MKDTRQEYPALMRTHKPDTRPWWVKVVANERVYLTPEQMKWSYEEYRCEVVKRMSFIMNKCCIWHDLGSMITWGKQRWYETIKVEGVVVQD